MISRGATNKKAELNVCGSSVFGRYPKISQERTFNMFLSDNWLVPYAGYQTAIPNIGTEGRGLYKSTLLDRMVAVFDNTVYLIEIFFDQSTEMPIDYSVVPIGTLQTTTGIVYIVDNNKPQVLISDQKFLYLYDPDATDKFVILDTTFTPGYITFHDTYFLVAAKEDNFYDPPAYNTWRLSQSNSGEFLNNDASIGFLQTKPDRCQAVVRFPSRGNMIFVLGETVTESWFDTGAQQLPYQRQNQYNIDYGCLNPATVAYTDELVVWLAQNEKSGPIIVASTGGTPKKITTDGIDYLFSQLSAPEDSQAFMYRQDGHLFYHINFYTDNLSLFYDFNTDKFYNATDENNNYFIASQVAFFNNQYYFVSRNNGNLYAFDTIYTTYDGATIPRVRICKNIRLDTQEYFVANDIGFTIEQGDTSPQFQESNNNTLITYPAVDLSISINGGETFGNEVRYNLNPLGLRKNKLLWWQCGIANDLVCQFKFWGMGRFVAYNGIVNVRQ